MGSNVDNSCPIPPTYDPSIFELKPTTTAPAAPACPENEPQPETVSAPGDSPKPQPSSLAPMQPFPMGDPLIKSALGPLLDIHDPKALAYAREVLAQDSEPADEKAVRASLGDDGVRNYRDMKNDLAEAHRVYQSTGQIPQTRHPFAWIEIQTGKMMTQAERYDAFMQKIEKNPNDVAFSEKDVHVDQTYLTDAEFHAQHAARIKDLQHQLHDECHTGLMRFQPLARPDCERKILEQKTNPGYMAERDEVHRKDRDFYQKVSAHNEEIANSGAVGTLGRAGGRAIGYGIGYATGGKDRAEDWANKGENYGGAVGGLGDAALPVVAGRSEMARAEAYQGSGGLEVRRENPAHVESAPPSNPRETQPGSLHERYAEPKAQTVEVQNSKPATPAGPPTPPTPPSSVSRDIVDTNTAITLDDARHKNAQGQSLTPKEQRIFNEFKGKDVWVAHAGNTELEAKGGTKEPFKVATDVKPSTKQERDAIYNDLQSVGVGGGDKKGEKDRMQIRQVLLTPSPSGKTNTYATADDGIIKGLFRMAHIPDPRPGHAGEFLDPAKLDGKSVPDFLRDVMQKDTFDVTVQGHKLTVRPLQ